MKRHILNLNPEQKKFLVLIFSGIFLLVPLIVFVPISYGSRILDSVAIGTYQNPGSPTGFVNDFAGMLTAEQRQSLEVELESFNKDTSNELSVVTVPNLGGDTVENFAVKLFEDWGIGKKNKNNGILLLIARDNRQMRIEIGYGLEGALTDAQSFWIIQNILRPAFQKGDYYGGINGGVDSIISITKGEFKPDINSSSNSGFNANSIFFLIWVSWIFFVWTGSVLARSKSWWGGGIVGGVISFFIAFGFTLVLGFVSALIFIPLGLWLDYIVSRRYTVAKESGQPLPWWVGGRGGSSGGGGGFGGFGGGRSGGGGSSGGW